MNSVSLCNLTANRKRISFHLFSKVHVNERYKNRNKKKDSQLGLSLSSQYIKNFLSTFLFVILILQANRIEHAHFQKAISKFSFFDENIRKLKRFNKIWQTYKWTDRQTDMAKSIQNFMPMKLHLLYRVTNEYC